MSFGVSINTSLVVELVAHVAVQIVAVSCLLVHYAVVSDFKSTEEVCLLGTMRRSHSGPQTTRLRLEDICSTILLPPGFLRLLGLHRRRRQIFGLQPKPFLARGPPTLELQVLRGTPRCFPLWSVTLQADGTNAGRGKINLSHFVWQHAASGYWEVLHQFWETNQVVVGREQREATLLQF